MRELPRFISAYERRQRIEAVMKLQGITWFGLAKIANCYTTTINRAMRVEPGSKDRASVEMIKRVAKALGVSAGFLIDRKETKHD